MDNLIISLLSFIIGLGVSLGGGAFVVGRIDEWRDSVGLRQDPVGTGPPGISGRKLGYVERLFFTLAIAADVSGAGVAMMAWLGVKMAANWGRIAAPVTGDTPEEIENRRAEDRRIRRSSIVALVMGLVSMGFALAGGVIARDGGALWGGG